MAAGYSGKKRASGPARMLVERPEPLVALEVPTLGAERMYTIYGHDKKGKLTCVLASLDGKSEVQALLLAAPKAE